MSRLGAFTIVVALGLAGCADDRPVEKRTVDASERTADAFEDERIYLASYVAGAGAIPLEGVRVCDDASGRCAETDEFGRFVLEGLTPQTETFITYRVKGYRSALHPLVTPRFSTSVANGIILISRESEREVAEQVQELLREAGRPEFDLSPEHLDSFAQIMFGAASELDWALDSRVHVTLDPPSGDGPFYELLVPRPGQVTLELTGEDVAYNGTFVNVEPREGGYEVVYSRDSGSSCTYYDGAYGGWPSRTGRDGAHHVPVRKGYLTWYTQAFCGSQ